MDFPKEALPVLTGIREIAVEGNFDAKGEFKFGDTVIQWEYLKDCKILLARTVRSVSTKREKHELEDINKYVYFQDSMQRHIHAALRSEGVVRTMCGMNVGIGWRGYSHARPTCNECIKAVES